MTLNGINQIIFYLVVLVLLAWPLGVFMAKIFQGEKTFLHPVFGAFEKFIYRVSGINPNEEMDWKQNAIAMLVFNVIGIVVVYGLQRLQQLLPLNPQAFQCRHSGFFIQYCSQFRDEHELAGIRRRNYDELLDSDAGV